jgi:hypothetical protein
MINGPTGGELEQLRAAAETGDADRVFAIYEAINARLGVPAGSDPAWAMRIIADGAHAGLARLAGDVHFSAVPLHADTAAEAAPAGAATVQDARVPA